MNNFRVIATCIDGSGAPLPVTWYGNAVSSSDAKFQTTSSRRLMPFVSVRPAGAV